MKRLILLMAIWAGCLTGIKAQSYPVTIKGIANFAANEEIRLVTFEELATYKSVVAATDKIDAKGHFLLTYNIIRPTLVQLVIRTPAPNFISSRAEPTTSLSTWIQNFSTCLTPCRMEVSCKSATMTPPLPKISI